MSAGYALALGGGQRPEDLIGRTGFDIFSAPYATAALEDELRVMRTGLPIVDKIERETFHDRPDLWVSTTKLPLHDETGEVIGTWGASRDVTLQPQTERELVHQSLHDALTGLPNRVFVIDRGEQMLARARRRRRAVAALHIDVDAFKQINDRFGHAVGDEALRTVASRLSGCLRETDTAGRLSGDEFVVLLEDLSREMRPQAVAERISRVVAQPIEPQSLGGRTLSVTVSIGIAIGRRPSADDLLRDADFALYEAKAAGKNRWTAFEPIMHDAVLERITLEADLKEAVAEEQFFLLYQPTFALRSERMTGVEALIRWRHPTRGMVSPDAFIPIAESIGLIVPIGRWVLRTAGAQARAWTAEDRAPIVSVNVSGRQLDDGGFVGDVAAALVAAELDPAQLTLEITETALMRDAAAAAARL